MSPELAAVFDYTSLALIAVVFVAFGFVIAAIAIRRPNDTEDLMAFLEQTGFSLQCLRGTNGDDDQWAVTDGMHRVVGMPSYDMFDAIRSAAGALGTQREVL